MLPGLAAILALATPLPAQENAPALAKPTEVVEHVEVVVAGIEVFVTDKKGNRITGLTREDFELFQDGEPVPITNFFAVEGGRLVVEPGQEPVDPAQEPVAEPQTLPLPESERLHLLVYVDNTNLRPTHRRWVLDGVREFLVEYLDSDDRVMLVTFDRSLTVRQPFTDDPVAVVSALYDVEMLTAHAVMRDTNRRDALREIDNRETTQLSAMYAARQYAEFAQHEQRFAIEALRDTVAGLAGLPGRKAVLYVSDGIEKNPGESLFVAVEERFGMGTARNWAHRYDFSRELREVTQTANSNSVVIYPLDATGLKADAGLSAEEGYTEHRYVMVDAVRSANLQAPLREMAGETGGLAMINTNAIGPTLRRIADDFNTYYSLGYRPPAGPNDQYHRVEVKVRRKRLKVRHREGYRNKAPQTELLEGTRAALRFGVEKNLIGGSVEFEEPRGGEDGEVLLPMVVKIPLGGLALVRQGDEHLGRVRVFVGVMDDKGDLSPIQPQEPAEIRIPAAELDQALTQYFSYALTLRVREGAQRVAVAIRDEISGKNSYVGEQVMIDGY